MANILLIDPDDMAQLAMRGILSRASHRCVAVGSGVEAWEFIVRNLKVDLVILELKLAGEDGLAFIQRIKSDIFLKRIPLVVYTAHRTRENVKFALSLGVQNYLVKPYDDDAILAEIAKTDEDPWYKKDLEKREAGGNTPEIALKRLQCRLDNLRLVLDVARASFAERLDAITEAMDAEEARAIMDELTMLHDLAEDVGATGAGQYLAYLYGKARSLHWADFKHALPYLDYYSRFIFWHMNPHLTPEDFLSEDERTADLEARSRILWETATEQKAYPVLPWSKLQQEIDALPTCPVIESVAAAFHMSANGSPTSLHPLMDLVDKDPALMTQVLISINQLRKSKARGGSFHPIEGARMAIGMLGELRLASLGRTLLRIQDGMMQVAPISTWLRFWMFQLGTAQIAKSICTHLELPELESTAYTAGLIHDIGKLLLLRLHPTGFQTILKHAIDQRITVAASERLHLGATTHQMAAHFADRVGLPKRFANVLRWVHCPELASEDTDLVAIVAVARHLCRQNEVGFSGHAPKEEILPLEDTTAWRVLQGRLFPSFQIKRLEAEIRIECAELHRELHGRWNEVKK